MAFRRGFKRRKPRVNWMPNPGTLVQDTGDQSDVAIQYAGIETNVVIDPALPGQFSPALLEAPLVQDQPTDEQFEGTTLTTYQRFGLNQTQEWGWRLRRIVGDMFFAYGALNGNDTIVFPGVLIEAGIIVRRVDTNGTPAVSADGSDPGTIGNNQDPWVWRRNWILGIGTDRVGTGLLGNNVNSAIARFPSTNTEYGSAETGARVDQKTARRIGPEERLFLNVNIWKLPLENGSTYVANQVSNLYLNFSYRVLGSIFTSAGNRRNASR